MTPSLAQEVRRLAVPAIAQSLLQTLVFVVDRIMLGHHGEASLAAMQIAGPLEWSIWSVFSAFTVGTIARVGRHVGAGDRGHARRAAWASIGYAVGAGLLVTAATPLVLAGLGPAMPRASAGTILAAREYLAWTLGGSPLEFLGSVAIAALQASGDTRSPLAIGLGVNAVHVATNRVAILGTPWSRPYGMAGAGFSTALTFALEAALALAVLSRRGGPVSLRRGGPRPPGTLRDEARELRGVALPALAERVLYHLGFLGFIWMITRLGDDVMAANQALISVESICFLSADGFGIAAAALVAQKLGAGRPQEARRCALIAARYAVVLLTTLGLGFLATRWAVLPVFSSDRRVVDLGASAAPVLALAQPFMATTIVLAQAVRGGGFTRAVLGVSAAGAFVVRLSCTYGFAIALGLGLRGVWLGSTCDWMVRSVLLVAVGAALSRRALPASRAPS
ncbi:MAG TPA: MATE family efflux transporter [Polyangiaceae bacterium]